MSGIDTGDRGFLQDIGFMRSSRHSALVNLLRFGT